MLGSRVMPSFAYLECHCILFRRARSQTFLLVHIFEFIWCIKVKFCTSIEQAMPVPLIPSMFS